MSAPRPLISAVISTYNRAELLAGMLESFRQQTLPATDFEIVIVDDGSTDDTAVVADAFTKTLPIQYAHQPNAGLAVARNRGVELSSAPLILFLDDDDVADPALLQEHVSAHKRHPEEHIAVLGLTRLAASIENDPLMHFVTEVGCFLFSYPTIRDGDILGFEYFWGGRTSCKRDFLLKHGVFNPIFRFGCEDIELAYRLSKHGLRVVYSASAITTMVRKTTFDDFCRRLMKQGRSSLAFGRLHPEPDVQRWIAVAGFSDEEREAATTLETIIATARNLDRSAESRRAAGLELSDAETALLYCGYGEAFRAAKLQGFNEAAGDSRSPDAPVDGPQADSARWREAAQAQCVARWKVCVELAEQQRALESEQRALESARVQITDMSRSLSWRVASFVRASAGRLGRGKPGQQ